VWSAIAGVISGLYMLLEAAAATSDGAKAALANYIKFCGTLVKKALAVVGWDPKDGDGHSTNLLRGTVIGLLDVFCSSDAEVLAEARRRYDAHWTDKTHKILPSEYKTTVFKMVLKSGGAKEYDEILKSYYSTEDNGEKKFALSSLGASPSTELKLKTLDWAVKSGDVKMQDFFYAIGSVASSFEGTHIAWAYFKDNLSYIKEKLSKASPSLMDATIGSSVGRSCTLESADEIQAFFSANPLPSSERRITQLLEGMRSNGAMLNVLIKSELVTPEYWNLGAQF
jgi:puromycin-sensitive aminopeptidase